MPQQEELVFRSTTRLVEFTIVALDKDNKPITDLRKEEVTVEDKGKARSLAFFRFEGAASTAASATPKKPLPPGRFSNRTESAPGAPRNITAIVLDTLNTTPTDNMWVRAQVLRFLRGMPPDTRVALYQLGSRISVIHDFTDDMDSLRSRLEKAVLALPPLSESNMETVINEAEALLKMYDYDPIMERMLREQIESDMLANAAAQQRRVEMTLSLLESLGRHLSGIPGRKNVVWIGGGISMLTVTGAMGFGSRGSIQSYEEKIRQTAQRLARQGIALYNVDAQGLKSPSMFDSSGRSAPTVPGRGRFERQQQAATLSSDGQPAMIAMADITGGRVIFNTNDPTDGVRKAATDIQGAYSLGFYLDEEPDGKWRTLKVRISRPGVRLRYQQGYLADAPASQPTAWTPEQWTAALSNPLGSSAVHIDAICRPAAGEEPGAISVEMRIEPADLTYEKEDDGRRARLELAVAEKGPVGVIGYQRVAGSLRIPAGVNAMPSPEESRYERTFMPRPGVTALRLLVRDQRTAQYGTLDVPLNRCAAPDSAGR